MTTHTAPLTADHRSVAATAWLWLKAIGQGILRASDHSARLAEIRALEARSDEDLAKMGLKREDIVRYVFRDLLYI